MTLKKVQQFLLSHEYLIWILCLCAILRLPSLLEPYWYGDEGIYLVLGNAVRHGLHLYKDIHDNKPPVIYWMAALTGTVFWFRFLLLLWNSVAIVAFERLARVVFNEQTSDGETKIFGISFPRPRFSTIATLLFATLPFFAEGNIANGEIFMIMPTIVGMLYLWKSSTSYKSQITNCIVAGLCFSLAFLTKVPALFDAIAAGFFFFILAPTVSLKGSADWKKILLRFARFAGIFSAAFLVPIIVTIVYYFALGAGKQYIVAAFAQNIGYLSSWSTGSHQATGLSSSGLKTRALFLIVGVVAIWIGSKKNGKSLTFILTWFALALFGALLSERPYPHYLIQVVPPLALLIMFGVRLLLGREAGIRPQVTKRVLLFSKPFRIHIAPAPVLIKIVSIVLSILVLLTSIWSFHFWYYPLLPYYANYIQFVTGNKSRTEYMSYFGNQLPNLYATAEFLARTTTPNDRVFVWGDDPMIYALSRRLPPGRFTSAYHINDFHGQEETANAIEATKPLFIVLNSHYQSPYEALGNILTVEYAQRYAFGPFIIYRRI